MSSIIRVSTTSFTVKSLLPSLYATCPSSSTSSVLEDCKEKDPVTKGSSSLTSSVEWGAAGSGLRDPDSVNFPEKGLPSTGKVRRKWQSREERRVDTQQCGDLVMVASDGGICLSGSQSHGPDWSIGLVEAHGPEFGTDDETDDGFAVLVPCYKSGCKKLAEGSSNQLLSAIKSLPNGLSSEGKNCMEWLSSVQNFLKLMALCSKREFFIMAMHCRYSSAVELSCERREIELKEIYNVYRVE